MKKKPKMKTKQSDPDFFEAVEAAYKLGLIDGERNEQQNHNSGRPGADRD